jgi:hypothetical protein
MTTKVNYVLDADIRGFFDAISHEWAVKFGSLDGAAGLADAPCKTRRSRRRPAAVRSSARHTYTHYIASAVAKRRTVSTSPSARRPQVA